MKRLLALLLSLAFVLSPALYAGAVETEPITKPNYENSVPQVLELFYRNIFLGENNALGNFLSDDVEKFLSEKLETSRYVDRLYGISRNSFSFNAKLSEVKEIGHFVKLSYVVNIEYLYDIFTDSDDITSTCETVSVLFDADTNKIVDYYTFDSYFDEYIKGMPLENRFIYSDSAYELDSIYNRSTLPYFSSLENKKSNLLNDIDRVYNAENIPTTEMESNRINVSRTGTGINRSAVVAYARNNYNKATPSSGGSSVPYYDFSNITGNYDCTNFVSHAILSGGAVLDYRNNGWYYRNLNDRTLSWSSVNQLHSYLVNNTTSGKTSGISNAYSTFPNSWDTGYIIQSKNSNNSSYVHSMIITRKEDASTRIYAYVTGRTSSTRYDDNKDIREIYPNGDKRTIYVIIND